MINKPYLFVAVLVFIALFAVFTAAETITSTTGEFNATNSPLYINWISNYAGNITLGNMNDTINVTLTFNNTTGVVKNQLSEVINFRTYNGTENGTNITIPSETSAIMTLFFNATNIRAGRYYGNNITIYNSTNPAENITNFSLMVDVPMTFSAVPRGVYGNISGNITSSTGEEYFFNTTTTPFVVGIRTNLTNISSGGLNMSLLDYGMTILSSAAMNSSSNTSSYIFSSFPAQAGYWLTFDNSTTTGNITFNGTVELLQASLMVNTTAYPSGTFDNDITDNTQNLTINDNLNSSHTFTGVMTFAMNNTANYVINVTNITLEAPNSKIISGIGGTANLSNSTRSYTAKLVAVGSIGPNATLNITNSSGDQVWYNNATEGQPFDIEGVNWTVTYVQTTAPAVAIVFGAPVTGSSNLTNGNNWMNYTIGLANFTLYNNSVNTTNFSITVNTSYTSNVAGMYGGWALIHTDAGYPYRAFKLGLYVNLTGNVNVTVNGIKNETDSAAVAPPGANILINVTPKYFNGTAIPNLNTSVSNWNVWAMHANSTALYTASLKNITLTILNVSADNSWNYQLNATIPSNALGGNYTVGVSADDNNTNINSGTGTFANFTINETALRIDSSGYSSIGYCAGGTFPATVGETFYCGYFVTNYGSRNATLVNVTRSISGCTMLDTLSNTINIGNMSSWGGFSATSSSTTNTWRFNASAAGTCTITITTAATGTAYDRQSITITLNVTAGTTSSTSSQNQQYNMTFNTTKALQVTSYPSEVTVHQGGKTTTTVKIKNIGAVSLADVKLNVTGVDSDWVNITPSINTLLNKNNEGEWTVKFAAPDEATIGNYSISYMAWAAGASDSRIAKLIVQPGMQSQSVISDTLDNYTARYNNLSALINQSSAAGINVTIAASKLAEAKSLLDSANAAKAEEDWAGVDALLNQIDDALTDAETALEAARAGPIWNININVPWEWVGGIAAAAVVVVAVFYMLRLRKPGYYPELGYRASAANRYGDKLKELAEKIKKMFSRKKQSYVIGS